jgi:hypothetical protein
MIPPGQPILVGHHSEKRQRAHLKRIDQHFAKAKDTTTRPNISTGVLTPWNQTGQSLAMTRMRPKSWSTKSSGSRSAKV